MLASVMSSNESAGASEARSRLERALGVVTEVRAGEGVTALVLTLDVFLLLTAYYVVKPVREGLILAMPSGAEYKSYLSAAVAVALLFVVPAYARTAGRVRKDKLVVGVTLFFASHLALFWALSKVPAVEHNLGILFFIWVGVFSMMVVAQFWSFANDLYTEERGNRLFPLVGIGASVGAALGAYITNFLRSTVHLGLYELLLVGSAVLAASAGLTHLAAKREHRHSSAKELPEARPRSFASPAAVATGAKKESGAFALVFGHRYLLLMALFSMVFTIVNTNGEYMLSVLVKARGKEAAALAGVVGDDAVRTFAKEFGTTFYGDFFLWVNILGVALQMFAVSRIVKFGGLSMAFFVLPVMALLDASLLLIVPTLLSVSELAVLRAGKIGENSVDYSVNNTVRNMLWLPTTTEMKYKAKQAVDSFFVRMGDVTSAVIVFVGGAVFHWPVRRFAMVNLVLVVVWLWLARSIVRENKAMTRSGPPASNEAEDKAAAA